MWVQEYQTPLEKPIAMPKDGNIELTSVDPGELARQLTLMMSTRLQAIQRIEFLNKAYDEHKRKVEAPNLARMLGFGERVKNIVIAEILRNPYVKDQVATYSFFLWM